MGKVIKYCFVGTSRVTGRREMIAGVVPQSLAACESVNLCMQKAHRKRFGRVVYNSVEEGLSGSIQEAIRRNDMAGKSGRTGTDLKGV